MTGGVVDEIWRSPLARFAVHSIGADGHLRFDGAVGAPGVVWRQTGLGDRLPEERAARHPDSLAAVLAEIIALGPRPGGFAGEAADDVTWSEAQAIARPGTLHIVLWQPADARRARTALVVIDIDGFGLVVPAREARRYRLRPVSPPILWAELCSLIGRLQPALAALDERRSPAAASGSDSGTT